MKIVDIVPYWRQDFASAVGPDGAKSAKADDRREGGERVMNMPVAVGDVIAEKYRVDRLLGSGGMGVVVAATHVELRTRRAIKVMWPHVVASPLAVERFLREARALSELRSVHVARVYDVGHLPTDAPFMVMEYLEGETLMARLAQQGPLPVEEAADYVLQACEALAEAHALGIVHRDLKPDNLFLTQENDGSPCIKVLDFGVSKLLHHEGPTRTSTGAIVGSPLYMSPEQINAARDVDPRSDIWSLGIILFQLVIGECPFSGTNVLQILAQLAQKTPPTPSTLRRDLPAAIDEVILRCLEKERTQRYPDVVALARALAPLVGDGSAERVARIERVHAVAKRTASVPPTTLSCVNEASQVDARHALMSTEPAGRIEGRDRESDLTRTPLPWSHGGLQTSTTTRARDTSLTSPPAKPRRAAVRNFAAGSMVLALGMPVGGFLYGMTPGARSPAAPVPVTSALLPPPPAGHIANMALPAPDEPPREGLKAIPTAASVGVVPISSVSTHSPTTRRTVLPQNRSTPRPPPRY